MKSVNIDYSLGHQVVLSTTNSRFMNLFFAIRQNRNSLTSPVITQWRSPNISFDLMNC